MASIFAALPIPSAPIASRRWRQRLRSAGVLVDSLAARDASDEEIERVHARRISSWFERETAEATAMPDIFRRAMCSWIASSFRVARRAAGGAIAAVEAGVAGEEAVFALVRPPGHHAEPDARDGFLPLQ